MPDEELVALLKKDDQQAYTEIYNRYHLAIYVHLFNKLRLREEARDIVHDLFRALWDKRSELILQSSLKAYLFTSARYRVFNWIAHKQVKSSYLTEIGDFMDKGECMTDFLVRENMLLQIINAEIDALPPKMREIFELSRKGGLSHKEIAVKLQISEQTVRKQVHNSLKILKTKLGPTVFNLFFF